MTSDSKTPNAKANRLRKLAVLALALVGIATIAVGRWLIVDKGWDWDPREWIGVSGVGPDGLRRIKISEVVLQQSSIVEGVSIAQWGEKWWLWLLKSPNIHSPAMDETGDKCQFGQQGPVWFLAGSYGAKPITRRCKVPEGRYILFPVANVFTRPRPLKLSDCATERASVEAAVEKVDDVFVLINGKEVPEIKRRHRERTGECFDSGTGRALTATDGYWIMLKPLPQGEYRIEFGTRDSRNKQVKTKHVLVILSIVPADTKLTDYAPWPVLPESVPGTDTIVEMHNAPAFDAGHVIRRVVGIIVREGAYVTVSGAPPPAGSAIELQFAPRDLALLERNTPDLVTYLKQPLAIWASPPNRDVVQFVVAALPEEEGPSLEWRRKTNADLRRILQMALDKTVVVTDDDFANVEKLVFYPWTEFTAHRANLGVAPVAGTAPKSTEMGKK